MRKVFGTGTAAVIVALQMTAFQVVLAETPEEVFRQASKAFDAGDFVTSMSLLRGPADQGHIESMLLLGYIYDWSEMNEEAVAVYRRAAESGSPEAAFRLGALYVKGEGVAQDYEEAFRWFEQATAADHGPAFLVIADAYLQGKWGKSKDVSLAKQFLSEAIKHGSQPNQAMIDQIAAQEKAAQQQDSAGSLPR